MTDKPDTPSKKAEIDQRAKRRSEQLRANLMRRKAQIRSRRSGAEDERGEGLPAANVSPNDEPSETD
ncbi:hypothetical protein [Pseudochrobactrum asaccharolyticum]|jgi:hypothetical protein|uniref:Uncharacterized protein n=1 Tax=Pseudochrobactrum asaccharolyticum TaxID=354351 RepID=A0A366DKI5_9HYPH|nr:hypothetical protein [Pseudochrobactrum asaccharolyticum]MDR2311016.1 hypothetical protein [Brucellaceae bacterium]RBO90546.1 hypothetical protein DFR47_11216 [Pseudochrobactrum asaccharolyticum]